MSQTNTEAEPGRPRLRFIARVVVIVIILALAVWAFMYWMSRDHAPEPVHAAPPAALEVTVIDIQPRDVPLEPEFLGVTRASQLVEIRVRINGFIEERAFEEGSRVEAGQLLYRIDPRPFEAALAVARARLANAEARLARAQRQVARIREAAGRGAASVTELDEGETEARVANADVQLAQAQVVQAELELSYTTLESPIAGVIGLSEIEVGSYVQAGERGLLATVQQIDPIEVEYSVSEQELLRWQRMAAAGEVRVPETTELPIALELSDGTRHPHEGRVSFFGVEISPTTGTTIARGIVPNPGHTLLAGQLVHVHVGGIQRLDAVTVPKEAVMQSPAGSTVYVVSEENTAEQRTVELGEWLEDSWVIRSGLAPGDRVIVDQLMSLRPGVPVRVTAVQSMRDISTQGSGR